MLPQYIDLMSMYLTLAKNSIVRSNQSVEELSHATYQEYFLVMSNEYYALQPFNHDESPKKFG